MEKLKLLYHKIRYANYKNPPMITFKRSYWYDERWEVMAKSGAIATECGWCGQIVPAYPLNLDGYGGTSCHECDRTVDEYYRDWIYRAEYLDGCQETIYQNGGVGSSGPRHCPHSAVMPNDEPIYEIIYQPVIDGSGCSLQELKNFFRGHVKRGFGWEEGKLANFIMSLPKDRNAPHQKEKKSRTDRGKTKT